MAVMKNSNGYVRVERGARVWDHELCTAQYLAAAGYKIHFVCGKNITKHADCYVNGVLFEMKSPEGKGINSVERNLKNALHQSSNVIMDSLRIRNVTDRSFENYLKACFPKRKTLKRLIFVGRRGDVIDIGEKV